MASDTLVIKDFSNEWLFYNSGDRVYQPLVEKQKFTGNTLHFTLTKSGSPNDFLQIISRSELSIFNGEKLVEVIDNDTLMISLSQLESNLEDKIPITLYEENIDPEVIQAKMIRLTDFDGRPLSEVAVTYKREKSAFSEFFVLALVVLLGVSAALYNYFPRVFIDYLKVSRAFSTRETEENLLKSRPLSQSNFFFVVYISLLCGLVLLVLFHLAEIQLPGFKRIYINSLWFGTWLWLRVSGVVFLWILGKLFLIYNITRLFHLSGFISSHYFNYLRIVLITILLFLSWLILNYFTFGIVSPQSYNTYLMVLLALFGLTVMMVYLKLMGASSLKSLHLFSYLCTTELVPYGIILTISISQAI